MTRIGILGTRGIPNHYGGFEQFASNLAPALVEHGAQVWVYNSHDHPYKEQQWQGVNIIRCYDPEFRLGAAGQFIYDLNCILDSRKRNFDILLQLGYTSSSVWWRLLPKKSLVVTNMDGMEWQRSKYPAAVRKFLKYAERLAVRSSHALVADAEPIRDYLMETYKASSACIAYGADLFEEADPKVLQPLGLKPDGYHLLIARMQPDNHVEEIIRGALDASSTAPLVVVGNWENRFGRMLREKYVSQKIRFAGGIFDQNMLNNLRYYCNIYFHGHSAGGTNPSLLEAMAAGAFICAHDNRFNRSVAGDHALYFKSAKDISNLINNPPDPTSKKSSTQKNRLLIKEKYNWPAIVEAYYSLFERLVKKKVS